MKHARTICTSTFLQCLHLQHIHESIITILYLQPYLTVSVHKDILHHLYKDISMVVHLLSFLLASLRNEILQSSLPTSLQSRFLRLSLLVSLQNGILQSSPLTSLQSKLGLTSLLTFLWKIFLRCLYKDLPTVTPIPSKPEILYFTIYLGIYDYT